MESIVERLIKVEEEAKKMIAAAKDEEEGLVNKLKQEKEEIEAAIMRDVQKEVDATKEVEAKRLAVASMQIEEQTKIRLTDMEDQYKMYGATWCDEIFNSIIEK